MWNIYNQTEYLLNPDMPFPQRALDNISVLSLERFWSLRTYVSLTNISQAWS